MKWRELIWKMSGPIGLVFVITGCAYIPGVKDVIRKMDDDRTERAKKSIEENPRFAELAKVCSVVKTPEGSRLLSKSLSGHGFQIYDYYHVDKQRPEIYQVVSGELFNEWRETRRDDFMGHDTYDFEKEHYRITLQLGGLGPNANFAISCIDSEP